MMVIRKNITKPGKIAGTVAFMAPELALGDKSSVLSDIYTSRSAIGATATAVTVDPRLIYEVWLDEARK